MALRIKREDNNQRNKSNNISQAAQSTATKSSSRSTSTQRSSSNRVQENLKRASSAFNAYKQAQEKARTQQANQQRAAQATQRMNTQYASSTPYSQQNQTQATTKNVVNNSGTRYEQQMRQAEAQARPTTIKSSIDVGKTLQEGLARAWNSLGRNPSFDAQSRANAHIRYDQNPVNGANPHPSRADQLYDVQMRLADQYARPTNSIDRTRVANDLNRVGQEQQAIVESNPALKAISDTNRQVIAGLENSMVGIGNVPGVLMTTAGGLTGNKDIYNAGRSWMDALDDADVKEALNNNNSVAGTLLGNVAQGVGGMIPSILMNPIGGGMATMLTGAYGSSAKEGIDALSQDGRFDWKDALRAQAYAAGNTGLEALSESLNPGLPFELNFTAKNILGEAGEEMFSEAFSPFLNPLIDPNLGVNGNWGEEYLEYMRDNTLMGIFDGLTGDPRGWEGFVKHAGDILEAGVTGALTSMVLSAPNTVGIARTERAISESTQRIQTFNEAINVLGSRYSEALTQYGVDSEQAKTAKEDFTAAITQKYIQLKNIDAESFKESEIKALSEYGELVEKEMADVTEQATDNGLNIEELDRLAGVAKERATETEPENAEQEVPNAEEIIQETPHQETISEGNETADVNMYELTADPELSTTTANGDLTVADERQNVDEIYATGIRQELRDNPGQITMNGKPIVTDPDVITDWNAHNVRETLDSDEGRRAFADNVAQTIGDDSPAGREFSDSITDEVRQAADEVDAELGNLADDFMSGEDTDRSKSQTRRYAGQTASDERTLTDEGSREYSIVHDDDLTSTARAEYFRMGRDNVYNHLMAEEGSRNVMKATIDLQLAGQCDLDLKQEIRDILTDRNLTRRNNGDIYNDKGELIGNITSETDIDAIKDVQDLFRQQMQVQEKMLHLQEKAGLFLRSVQLLYNADPVFRTRHLDKQIQQLNQKLANTFKSKADSFKKVTVDPLSLSETDALTIGFTSADALRRFIQEETGGRWNEKKIDQYVQTYFGENTSEAQRSYLVQDAVDQRIANQIPSTLHEKTNAWRYLMMLANPVTHTRNITGNALMQIMTANKNVFRYMVESTMARYGDVYTDNLDLSDQRDIDLVAYARDHMNQALIRDYDVIRNMNRSDKRAYLEQHGYTGDILKSMMKATGQFETVLNSVTADRWSNHLANALKDAGAVVENGELVPPSGETIDFDQMSKDAFNTSRSTYIKQTDFHMRGADGSYSRAGAYFRSKADAGLYQLAEQFERGHNIFASQDPRYSVNNEARGSLEARVSQKRHYFSDNNWAGWLTNRAIDLNGRLMSDIEDTKWFTRPRYQAAFVQELKTQGYSMDGNNLVRNGEVLTEAQRDHVLNQISDKAIAEAEKSTYHDASIVADWISKGRRIKGLGYFLDAVVPFTTTPINIGKRIIEYSPIGLIKGLTYDVHAVREGKITADTFIDNVAKGCTGTTAAAIGAWLCSLGFLTPKDDDESTESAYKRGLGQQQYALHIGDVYYSLDQFAPTSTAVLFGAQIFDTVANQVNPIEGMSPSDVASKMLTSTLDILNPMMDMSMISSLNDMLEDSDDVSGIVKSSIASYLGQFTPTAGARFNAIIGQNKKTTYSNNFFQNIINQHINKIPGLPALLDWYDETHGTEIGLADSITRQGENQENAGVFDQITDNPFLRGVGRAFYNTLSPGNLTYDKTTEYDEEAMRLFETTGNDVLPKYTTLRDSNGNYYDMTPSEQERYNKMYYGNYRDDMIEFMNSETYKTLTGMEDQREADRIKSEILFQLQRHESNMVNADYFGKTNPKAYDMYASDKACEDLAELGVPKWQYYYIRSLDYDKDAGGENIMNTKQMKARQMLEAAGVYDDVIDAYKRGDISLSDVGLNSYVAKWTEPQYKMYMDQLENGMYNPYSGKPQSDPRETFTAGLEKNEQALATAESAGLNAEQYYGLMDVKSDYGDDGKSISYSQDMKARQAAIENGSWDIIQRAIANGDMTIAEASEITGIGKTVLKWSDEQFEQFYGYLQDGSWTNDTAKSLMKTGKTGGSSGSSGRSSGRRSSGRRSSGRSSGRRSGGGGSSGGSTASNGALSADQAADNYMKYLAKALSGTGSGSGSTSGIKAGINESQLMSLYKQIMDKDDHYSIAKKIVQSQKV